MFYAICRSLKPRDFVTLPPMIRLSSPALNVTLPPKWVSAGLRLSPTLSTALPTECKARAALWRSLIPRRPDILCSQAIKTAFWPKNTLCLGL